MRIFMLILITFMLILQSAVKSINKIDVSDGYTYNVIHIILTV